MLIAALASLSGCQSVLPQFGALGDTWRYAVSKPPATFGQFKPGHEYMLIETDGRQVVVALGERTTSASAQGETVDEYWYSANREMLHLRNGRLHTVLGMTTEWRGQSATPPTWTALLAHGQPHSWSRTRDEMPHYRYGITDRIVTQPVPAGPRSASASLPTAGRPVRWVQDQIETLTPQGQRWSFTQHFAVAHNQVVYSEQCIAPGLCLRIQHKLLPKS